jgi:hypothetical protein
MAAATNALPEVGLVQPARRRRQFIDENATPLGALVWRTARQKAKLFDQWRVAIGKLFPSSARVLRVAWALEWLFGQEGFAYATDSYLSRKLGIPSIKFRPLFKILNGQGASFALRSSCRISPSVASGRPLKSSNVHPLPWGVGTPPQRPANYPPRWGDRILRKALFVSETSHQLHGAGCAQRGRVA